jgi:hypothetical protein
MNFDNLDPMEFGGYNITINQQPAPSQEDIDRERKHAIVAEINRRHRKIRKHEQKIMELEEEVLTLI